MFHLINNCRSPSRRSAHLLSEAKRYWIGLIQNTHFSKEISGLRAGCELSNDSSLIHLHPFIDLDSLLLSFGNNDLAINSLGYNMELLRKVKLRKREEKRDKILEDTRYPKIIKTNQSIYSHS